VTLKTFTYRHGNGLQADPRIDALLLQSFSGCRIVAGARQESACTQNRRMQFTLLMRRSAHALLDWRLRNIGCEAHVLRHQRLPPTSAASPARPPVQVDTLLVLVLPLDLSLESVVSVDIGKDCDDQR